MAFEDAGFRFLYGSSNVTSIFNQKSGSVFGDTLKVQAVKNTNGVCTGLFNGNKSIELSQENVEPSGQTGLSFYIDTNNGIEIGKHTDYTNVTLNFDSDSIAIIPAPIYHDAGEIRLHANYNVSGVTLSGSSNSFWVIPDKLVISATYTAENLDEIDINGDSSSGGPIYRAGADFNLTVSAYNAATPSLITQNYSPGQIELKLERTGPIISGVEGTLTYKKPPSSLETGTLSTSLSGNPNLKFEPVTLSDFNSGVSTSNAQYSEVGLIQLAVKDSNYANDSISADVINIGRFTPAYFKQTVVDEGELGTTCGIGAMFAYSGQKNEAGNKGTITYKTSPPVHPVLAITAYDENDLPLQNYYDDITNDYMKLSALDVHSGITALTSDQAQEGVDTNKLLLTSNMTEGELSQEPLGVLHYKLSSEDDFYYNRSANALVGPFQSNIKFAIGDIEDEDGIKVESTTDVSPEGVEIRFGRLRLENSFGPETSDLPQPMQVEHFDGTNFVLSSDNDCISYDKNNIELTDFGLDPIHSGLLGDMDFFENGKTNKIRLKAPGVGNRGKIGVSYDTYDWLKYDWENDDGLHNDNPTAIATFGLFRGNDRIIYWHEVSK
jgi:MSHA biogenesis protein MshQ